MAKARSRQSNYAADKKAVTLFETSHFVLSDLVREVYRQMRPLSVAVGVFSHGREDFCVLGQRAYPFKRANADTVYGIASASKAFIATSLLLLQEQGLLNIDDPLVRYLPELRLFNEELTAAVTIRDALCHRTGLPRHDIQPFVTQTDSLNEMVAKLRWLEPAYGLRERFHYQNHMYGVLSLLLERVSKQDWGNFVRTHLFEPLQMQRSYTSSGAAAMYDDNYARPSFQAGSLPVYLPVPRLSTDNTGGAGSLSCSIRDLLAWGRFNLAKGRLADGSQLLSHTQFSELHRSQISIKAGEMRNYTLPFVSDEAYGLGWFIERYREQPRIYHGGTYFGCRSMVGFLPEHDFAYAVLSNHNATFAPEAIANMLCDQRLGVCSSKQDAEQDACNWVAEFSRVRQAQQRHAAERRHMLLVGAAPQSAKVLADSISLAGTYQNPAYGKLRISQRGKKLTLHFASQHIVLQPDCNGGFVACSRLTGDSYPCRFEVAQDRSPAALLLQLDEDLLNPIRFERL